jgi:hypothetical protein
MSTERDEEQWLLEEHPWEGSSDEGTPRCSGCGSDLDGHAQDDRPPLREGLCYECWQEDDARKAWKRANPDPIQRVVQLGEDSSATFVIHPKRIIWLWNEHSGLALPYFDPSGYTDQELVKKVKLLVLLS